MEELPHIHLTTIRKKGLLDLIADLNWLARDSAQDRYNRKREADYQNAVNTGSVRDITFRVR